nr:hypothetical protein [Paenibacillus tyrfis]
MSLNLYTYVENNPLKFNDPTGHIKNSTYFEIDLMISESMSLRKDSKEYLTNRSQLGTTFQPVFNDANNNRFNYLFGLLTQTSSYENSIGNAEWARSELLNALDKYTDFKWEIGVSAEETLDAAAAVTPSRKNAPLPKLSGQHYIPRPIVYQYEEIKLGRGVPNLDNNGVQKVYHANELKGISGSPSNVWDGSLEYLVPGSEHHRILKRADGKLGYVIKHGYGIPKLFPGPWFSEGGKP